MFRNVLDDVLDSTNIVAFAIVARWVAPLVDDGAQRLCPVSGCLQRPHWRLANSEEMLAVVNAIDEKKSLRAISVDANAKAAHLVVPYQVRWWFGFLDFSH